MLIQINSYSFYGVYNSSAGFQVVYDLSKPSGNRVKSVNVLCTKCRVPRYEPLNPKKLYKLVLPSYLVDGGDDYTMIKEKKLKHDSGKSLYTHTFNCTFHHILYFAALQYTLNILCALYSVGDLDIAVVASYITERKRVHPAVEGRIQFASSCIGLRGYVSTILLVWVHWVMFV